MTKEYQPQVTEGYHPEDGGWTKLEQPVLLLSLPVFADEWIHQDVKAYDYAWLFDKQQNSYIFCFRLHSGVEKAILFQANYAGRLLLEPEAYQKFTIAITNQDFNQLTDESDYLLLENIELARQSVAGW